MRSITFDVIEPTPEPKPTLWDRALASTVHAFVKLPNVRVRWELDGVVGDMDIFGITVTQNRMETTTFSSEHLTYTAGNRGIVFHSFDCPPAWRPGCRILVRNDDHHWSFEMILSSIETTCWIDVPEYQFDGQLL